MNNEHHRSYAHVPPVSRKRKIDSAIQSTSSNNLLQNGPPLQPVALNSNITNLSHPHASVFAPTPTLATTYSTQHQGTLAQPYWANYGHRSTHENKRTLVHSTTPEARTSSALPTSNPFNPSPLGNTLLPAVNIDLSPSAKRARLTPSHANSLETSAPLPLPTTSASLPRHLQAFTRAAPRPRARIIVADVHRMGRIAVHADVFNQIIEQEERVMGPGGARTRRARRRERTRSGSGVSSRYTNSIDSGMADVFSDTPADIKHDVSSTVEDNTDISGPWPDTQYPWSLVAVQVEDKRVRSRHAELAHVERWLGTAEDELEENGEPAWNASSSGLEGGLSGLDELPGFSNGPAANPSLSDSVASDEDGADARTALLARASVQEFIARRTARAVLQHTASGDVVRCICRAGADGRPMIRCSKCRTWAHRICMDAPGVGNNWRCWRCAPAVSSVPESTFVQPTFVPNSTPGRRIVAHPPPPTRAVQWQPSPLFPSVPLPETPERAASFPFHSFITPRFFTDFARRDTDDEDVDMAEGSPTRQQAQSPSHKGSLQSSQTFLPGPSPSTPPLRSNASTTPMTPERSTGPRPRPQHSGSTAADSAGPASPAGAGGSSMYAGGGLYSGPGMFTGDVGVYAGEDSPVRQRRVHRVWQFETTTNAKAPSDMGARRGDGVAR